MTSKRKSALLLSVAPMIIGAAVFAAPSYAQTAPDPGVGPQEGQVTQASADGDTSNDSDIVVTGSRLRSPNLEGASPVTVLSQVELKQTGTTRVEDLLNSLPQVFAGQNAGYSNGSSGTSTVNLRGLGSERNLVLVNGRRLVPGDPTTSAADINVIPGAIVKRIDVLTGGASSVYGADAVSGVVNFVMDTDFEGLRLDSQYSFYNHNNRANSNVTNALAARGFGYPDGPVADGGTVDVSAAFGTKFADDRGHITAYAGYRKIEAVTQDRRDYSACSLSANTAAATTTLGREYNCGGSATSANGSFILYDDATSTIFQVGNGRTFVPGSTPFNFAPTNYFQRPDERYTAGFFANFEISDAIKPYAEFMFMDDRTVAQIAPSGNFGNTFNINCDNPLLSAQQRSIVCDRENLLTRNVTPGRLPGDPNIITDPPLNAPSQVAFQTGLAPFNFINPLTGASYNRGFLQPLRRNVEGGPRRDDLQHTSYRFVGGVKGDLSPVWNYDAFYQYGRTIFAETYFNDFSVSRLTKALDVVTNPNGGAPVCRSVLDGSDPNCVPYDIFAPGQVTQAAINYLQVPGFQRGINGETVVNASISGQLGEYGIQSPWASDGVGIVIGGEYRRETLDFFSDAAFQAGDLAGQGAATLPVAGEFNVKEVFTEARLPVVSRGFFYDLSFTGGYRYSSYKTSAGNSFNTNTYKIEGEFAPIRDIRFRGGYNRAVRAPTIQDFFAPQRVALNGSSDPCAGFRITAANAGCIAQGLVIGQLVPENPASQYNGLIGGTATLRPEVADTYTAGVVLQPRFIPGLAISVDYFDIKLRNAVQGIGQDTILQVCTDTSDPFYCSLVRRDNTGSLWRSNQGFVVDLTRNIGGVSTRGIDVNGSYTVALGSAGSIGLSFVGTYLDSLKTDTGVVTASNNGKFDCVKLYGNVCGTPNPEWRHTARVSFTSPGGLGASVRWRYYSSVTIDALDMNPNLRNTAATGPAPGGVARPGLDKLNAISYFDLALTAKIGEHYNFRLGATNLLDKQPPLTGSQSCPAGPCNGNTWPGVYDAIGRYIYAGVTLDF